MHERILTYVNLALVAICAACIYYLVTQKYETPAEIRQLQAELDRKETDHQPGVRNIDAQVAEAIPRKDAFLPFYTPTPTPTPSPTPTPAPPPVTDLIYSWTIQALNPDSVEIQDARGDGNTPVTFTLRPGESHPSKWKDGQFYDVKLESIDLNEFKVNVSFGGQPAEIKM